MSQAKRLFIATQGFRPFDATIVDASQLLGPVRTCEAVLRTSDVRIAWTLLPGVTTYTLQKSTDGGRTFTTIATAAGLTTDPLYDASLELFVYDDVAGAIGHLYLLQITDGLRVGVPCFATPELDPDLVTIFGVILSPDGGKVDELMRRVEICAVGDSTVIKSQIPGVTPDLVQGPFHVFASEDGVWNANIIPGARVRIRIPSTDVDKIIRVPSDNTRAWAIEELRSEGSLNPDGDC